MLIPEVEAILDQRPYYTSVVLFGIEVSPFIPHPISTAVEPILSICIIYLHTLSPLTTIKSHVCILQTVLSLFARKAHKVHIIADGVSSSNAFEVPIALERMRTEGAVIGTSESVAFQLMRDAASSNFKAFSQFIKDEKERTKAAGEALLQVQGKGIAKSSM